MRPCWLRFVISLSLSRVFPLERGERCICCITQGDIEGTLVLNEPVRSTQFCERKFTEKVRSLEPILDDVAALENRHVSVTLNKFCPSV